MNTTNLPESDYKSSNFAKYQTKNFVVNSLIKKFLENVYSSCRDLPLENTLDVGCGEGIVLNYLRDRGFSSQYEGIDVSSQAIVLAKQLHQSDKKTVFKTVDAGEELGYSDNSFDLVMAIEVLEHLTQPQHLLLQIQRVAKKYCIFSVPWEPYFRIGNFLRGKNWKLLGNDPEHIHNWGIGEFKNLLSPYFSSIELKKSFPWIIAVCQVDRE